MKQMSRLVLVTAVLFLVSCAVNYHTIKLSEMESKYIYGETDTIKIKVFENPLAQSKNKRYFDLANEQNLTILGIQLINITDAPFSFKVDRLEIYDAQNNPLTVLNSDQRIKALYLKTWPYWLYSPLLLAINGAPIPIGLGIAFSNSNKARESNLRLWANFKDLDLDDKIIGAGDKSDFLVILPKMQDKSSSHKILLKNEQGEQISSLEW